VHRFLGQGSTQTGTTLNCDCISLCSGRPRTSRGQHLLDEQAVSRGCEFSPAHCRLFRYCSCNYSPVYFIGFLLGFGFNPGEDFGFEFPYNLCVLHGSADPHRRNQREGQLLGIFHRICKPGTPESSDFARFTRSRYQQSAVYVHGGINIHLLVIVASQSMIKSPFVVFGGAKYSADLWKPPHLGTWSLTLHPRQP
jgi:hypothetical protein